MADTIDMRGSWAANVARSQAKNDARLNIQRAHAEAFEKEVKRTRTKRNKPVDAPIDAPVQEPVQDPALEPEQVSKPDGDVVTE